MINNTLTIVFKSESFCYSYLEINCGNPGLVTNGNVLGGQYFYGSTITFECNTDFNLTRGSSHQTCRSDATWSDKKPLCLCE